MGEPYFEDELVRLYLGNAVDVLRSLPDGLVDCCVTSPPYFGLRDYGVDGQIGLERSPTEYVEALVAVFTEVHRVLAAGGTLWLNLGDSYSGKANGGASFDRHRGAGHRAGVVAKQINTTAHAAYKSLLGIPWRVAFALQDAGWTLRNAVVWHKPNSTPESVKDRLTNRYELVFLFTPGPTYHFDLDAIRVPHTPQSLSRAAAHRAPSGLINGGHPSETAKRMETTRMCHPLGANPGDIWTISNTGYPEAHFATFPVELPTRCIRAGCVAGGTVLDPFSGTATTGAAARALGRRYVGIDIRAEYHDLALRRFWPGTSTRRPSAPGSPWPRRT